MSGRWSSRSAQLEALLDEAFELDPEACTRFLDTLEPELREHLAMLLKADAAPCLLDRGGIDLVEAVLSGHADDARSAIAAGQQIGSYRLVRLLGEGGMASVWLAERVDGRFNHQVAVKCLKTGLATPESRTRFLLEQQIMAQMLHPYIARLYDAGVSSDNVPFIVMEWIDGVPQTRYCDERRLGLTERLQLFLKVCSAVAHAHQNLVVHRDLKPANILVGNDGEPRLLDFGIAKLLDESAPVTRTGAQMLTPEYAAPEQFNGGAITTATDIYMLGANLYELLCGLRPRNASLHAVLADVAITAPSDALRSVSRTVTAITDRQHPEQLAAERGFSPERLRRTLRGDLDTIVLKALQADPSRRYPTVEAFSEDIGRYLRQQPISARKDAGMYRAGRFLQRHAIAVALGALVIVGQLAATTVSVYQARRAENETRHAQTEATRALAIKEFLTDLFEISDAGMPRDQVPTTQTLLQDGAKRIRGEFADAPDVKFDLLLLLGRIQFHLGQYASAEPLLKEALSIANAKFTSNSVPWLEAQTEWARVLTVRNQYALAAQQLSAAIATHQHAGAADSDALADGLAELSWIDSHLDQSDRSVASARRAVEIARRLHGERHPKVQEMLDNLARMLQRAERLDEAETVGRANVVLSSELYGDHNAKFAHSLTVLAHALADDNKLAESERLARQALAIEESVYDRPNAALIATLSSLCDTLFNEDKIDEFDVFENRLLAAQTQLSGPDDPSVAPFLANLSLLETRRHRYEQAEAYMRRVLSIDDKRPDSIAKSLVGDMWRNLADALIAQHRLPEATTAAQKAIEIDLRAFGNRSHMMGMDLNESAFVDMEMGRLQPALERVDAALEILGKCPPDIDLADDVNIASLQKSAILNRLGRHDDAKALLMDMMPRLRKVASDYAHLLVLAQSVAELGRAQAGSGDISAALASWNEALTWQQSVQWPDTHEIAELQGLIAQAHRPPRDTKQ